MDKRRTLGAIRWRHLTMGLVALVSVLLVACGTSAPPAQDTTTGSQPEATVAKPADLAIAPTAAPQKDAPPTAVPQATTAPEPAEVMSARDTVRFVTNEEPTTLGAASPNCGGNIQNTVCDDIASDPLTWIDDFDNFEVKG
ncbi:MAG: hypothetical protein ACE5Q6_17685, partial [Dehalococcoidia bacterium]